VVVLAAVALEAAQAERRHLDKVMPEVAAAVEMAVVVAVVVQQQLVAHRPSMTQVALVVQEQTRNRLGQLQHHLALAVTTQEAVVVVASLVLLLAVQAVAVQEIKTT
jgi:hypothetical protein